MNAAPSRLMLALAALAAASPLPSGCASDPSQGYSFATTYPKHIKTVSIPIFDNYTFSPGLEVQLTDAVIKEVQRSTGLRVTTADTADSRLTGVITKTDMRRLTLDRNTALVQEEAVQLTINFEWRDNGTGKTLVQRTNFASTDTFLPTRAVGERIETGQEAAIQRLARDIVAEMRSAW